MKEQLRKKKKDKSRKTYKKYGKYTNKSTRKKLDSVKKNRLQSKSHKTNKNC